MIHQVGVSPQRELACQKAKILVKVVCHLGGGGGIAGRGQALAPLARGHIGWA